jgi:hypothetical protein
MNNWIIMAVVIGLLLMAGIVVSIGISSADNTEDTKEDSYCNYGKECTEQRNCGRDSCGAAYGGSCGCRG